MATSIKPETLRKSGFLTTTTPQGDVVNVIAPNGLQVGLRNPDYPGGIFVALGGISGSLTRLPTGKSFLRAGTNISIVTGSGGQITIGATGFPSTAALTNAGGIEDLNYDGLQAQSITVALSASSGLAIVGGKISFNPNLVTANRAATATDQLLVTQTGLGNATALANITVQGILDLGTAATLQNPITFGSGIYDTSIQGATSYNNSQAVTMAVKVATNGGLLADTSGVGVAPNSVGTIITAASTDVLLVADANNNYALGKTTAQSIADLATTGILSNALTTGDGLQLSGQGSVFDGSSARTISAKANGSTVSIDANGISVLSIPNALTNSKGIKTLSFDGSGVKGIEVDLHSEGGLVFTDNPGAIRIDIETLNIGATPALSDEIAVSFGPAATRKVDLSVVRGLFNTGPVSIQGDLQVTGSTEATGYILAKSGLSGSLTRLSTGAPYIVAGLNMTVTSESNGQITLASTTGGDSVGFFTTPASGFLNTTGSTAFAGGFGASYKTSDVGTDVVFFVSGTVDSRGTSTRGTSLFGGDTVVSGALVAQTGLSGSLTRLADDTSYIRAGSNITVTSASNGAITIASPGGGDAGAEYLVLAATASLSAERVFTLSTGLSASDAGSGGAYSIATHPQKFVYEVTGSHTADEPLIIPDLNFSINSYNFHKNDIFLNGQLMTSGSGKDYVIAPASGSNAVAFSMNLLSEDVVIVRQS